MPLLTRLEAQRLAALAVCGADRIPRLLEATLAPLQALPGMRLIAALWADDQGAAQGLLAGSPQWLALRPGALEWPDIVRLREGGAWTAPQELLTALGLPLPGPEDESTILALGQTGLLVAVRGALADPSPPLAAVFHERLALLDCLLPLTRLQWPAEPLSAGPPDPVRTGISSELPARLLHELRGPLSVISGYAQILTQDLPSSPVRARFVESIRTEALHLTTLVEDLQVFTDLQAGRTLVNPAPFRVDTALTEVVRECTTSLGVPRARVEIDPQGMEAHEAIGDGPRFRRIVGGLLHHALQQNAGGPIRVQASRSDDSVMIDVEDRGRGIPDALVESVFEPFALPSSRGHGRGLGMAIAHALARLLGGSLVLRQNGPSGTRFGLTLPLPLAVEAPPAQTPPVPNLVGRRVLLVEDSPEIQYILREYLRPTRATVVQVYDGQSAVNQVLAMAAAGTPADLMLMDHQLPELDGYSATRKIRQHFPTLPIVAITGAGIETNRQLAERSGCSAWLPKPIAMGDFYRTIGSLLEPMSAAEAAPHPGGLLAGILAVAAPAPGSIAELLDPDFQDDLRGRYRSRMAGRLEGLVQARHAQDLEAARRLAHQLRGSAASFGYAALGGLAERAEEAIVQGRAQAQVEVRLDELAREMQRILAPEQLPEAPRSS